MRDDRAAWHDSRIALRSIRATGAQRGARSAGTQARCRVIPIHHVKQRSLLRSRGALLRPGFAFLFSIRPDEGRVERRKGAVFPLSRVSARDGPRLLRRGARPAGRARLSALHRGDFRSGAALPSPAFLPDLCSELLAARSLCLAGGVPDLPGPWLRAAAAGRHSSLRLRLVSGDGPLR
jgi:hypothetical protein